VGNFEEKFTLFLRKKHLADEIDFNKTMLFRVVNPLFGGSNETYMLANIIASILYPNKNQNSVNTDGQMSRNCTVIVRTSKVAHTTHDAVDCFIGSLNCSTRLLNVVN